MSKSEDLGFLGLLMFFVLVWLPDSEKLSVGLVTIFISRLPISPSLRMIFAIEPSSQPLLTSQ